MSLRSHIHSAIGHWKWPKTIAKTFWKEQQCAYSTDYEDDEDTDHEYKFWSLLQMVPMMYWYVIYIIKISQAILSNRWGVIKWVC